ncbi:cation diffusion facilitator family transporter [Desulfitobacterium dichloroeliminans]|uniref:cation diffusion facilitator family transporter n=1 Tax=Desulfitobacterium dichloroeliminans TaxID=233055 RepID=UPI00059C9AFE|nr:cation diffusion facilitator family transporter [Desulfitobacterium dichloroeliminans]
MIRFIIRRSIPRYENTTDKQVRESYGVLAGVLGIVCNLILFTLKLIIGLLMNSIAVISDAFNNLSDCGSSIISIIAAKMSNQPPDLEHPFGHGRIEYISSLIVSFIIIMVGFELLKSSFSKILHPEVVIFSSFSLIILVLSVVLKLWMVSYNRYIGRVINSSIINATATDSLNDAIATSAVILSTLIGHYLHIAIDGYVGLLISFFILYTGYTIAKDTVNILLGASPNTELANQISGMVNKGMHIIGTHDLKVHDYGPGRTIASIHAEILDTVNIVESHAIIDDLEKRISEELNINIVIHIDPLTTDELKIHSMKHLVKDSVKEVNEVFVAHHIRMTKSYRSMNVIFELTVPSTQLPESANIREQITKRLKDKDPQLNVIINSITAQS